MQILGSMISGDNGGDLDGVSSMNDAECALDHWLLARRSLGVLIVVAFIFFSPCLTFIFTRYLVSDGEVRKYGGLLYQHRPQFGAAIPQWID